MESENNLPKDDGLTLYVAPMGDEAREKAFAIVSALRKKGVTADTDHMARGIKAQFKYADKIGAKFVAVLGSDELVRGVIKLKDMASGEEKDLPINDIAEFF